ncbi:Checkpoint kinase 2 [Irineochytrium annulatum]|nr:Checkpoint kinase 2 [Irineochytrium annulatum]
MNIAEIPFLVDTSKVGTTVNGAVVQGSKFALSDFSEIQVGEAYFAFFKSDESLHQYLCDNRWILFRSLTLGSGAFSTVVTAFDVGDKCNMFACKIVARSNIKVNIESELKILRKISHPNIIAMKEFIATPDTLYIFLERFSGGDLFSYIEARQRIPPPESKFIVFQVLLALEHLHLNNISHRDVKPENILLSSTERFSRVVLTDFGLAKAIQGGGMQTKCGTSSYLAPEVFDNKGMGYKKTVDSWSLGIMLYFMECGYLPFGTEDDPDLQARIRRGAYKYDEEAEQFIPKSNRNFISRLLEVDPARRMTISAALQHPWISDQLEPRYDGNGAQVSTSSVPSMTPLTYFMNRKRKWDVGPDGPSQKAKLDNDPGSQLGAKDLAELAACKINAMLAAQKSGPGSAGGPAGDVAKALQVLPRADAGEVFKDITINDLKNRYLLTKGSTQLEIKKETGADVVTRGKYYSDVKMATEKDPPLYLHISAINEDILEKAIKKIEELIEQAHIAPQGSSTGGYTGVPRGYASAKYFIDFEPDRFFNVRAKIVGPQGKYVKHIQQETGAKVFLKGKGSGYEMQNSMEPLEGLHLHITGPTEEAVDKAKRLCEDLVDTVKEEYERYKRPPPPPVMPMYPQYGMPGADAYGYPPAGYMPPPPGSTPPPPGSAPPGVSAPGVSAPPGTEGSYPGADAAAAYPGADPAAADAYSQYYNNAAWEYWAAYSQYQQPDAAAYGQYQQPPPGTEGGES